MAAKSDRAKDRKLYDAVKKSDNAKVMKLLEEGANPNSPVGKNGMTSMARAVQLPARDIERVLLSKGGTLHRTSTLCISQYYISNVYCSSWWPCPRLAGLAKITPLPLPNPS